MYQIDIENIDNGVVTHLANVNDEDFYTALKVIGDSLRVSGIGSVIVINNYNCSIHLKEHVMLISSFVEAVDLIVKNNSWYSTSIIDLSHVRKLISTPEGLECLKHKSNKSVSAYMSL